MAESSEPEIRLYEFKCQPHHSLALWPWASGLSFLPFPTLHLPHEPGVHRKAGVGQIWGRKGSKESKGWQ